MFDYIIVGQGLAGSVLGLTFLNKGKKILILNNEDTICSSRVSAGLFNPVTGKRITKTWKAEELFPFLIEFYRNAEKTLRTSFLTELPVFRPFSAIFEQNDWMGKSGESGYQKFVNNSPDISSLIPAINIQAGGFETRMSGILNVGVFLDACRNYFIEKKAYIKGTFPTGMNLKKHLEEQKIQAKKIIFCEGSLATKNPLFSWLPFAPVKGDLLTLEIENFKPGKIINKNGFLIPLGNKLFKAGSTYEKNFTDNLPSENASLTIQENIKTFLQIPVKVVRHTSGIRPATKDRRPIIGLHPEDKTIGIFNGLGTKGVSLAPYFAEEFYNFLENEIEMTKEVSIDRFSSYYKASID